MARPIVVLPAAALADQAEHLARADREADAVHGDEVRAAAAAPGTRSAGPWPRRPARCRPAVGRAGPPAPGARGALPEPRDGGEQLLGVGVLRARRTASRTSASSTISPWYMTATRSARSATTPMLWVISTIAVPNSSRQRAQQVEDLGLHGDVEGGGRLVGDDHARVEHERLRDDDALLLPAGELVRVVVDPRAPGRGCRPGGARRSPWPGPPSCEYLPCARSPSAICQPTV